MEITAGFITDFLGGTIIGDRNVVINGASTIEGGRPEPSAFFPTLNTKNIYTILKLLPFWLTTPLNPPIP